jgi:putative transposase
MIDLTHNLSVVEQCRILEVSRSTAYYQSTRDTEEDLALMREIDELYLERPYFGSRRMRAEISTEERPLNRKRVQRLMRVMGLVAIYPKKRLSTPGKGHKIYAYLLRKLKIVRPNQVWAADFTYLPMPQGFLYLVAVIDWYSRKVLSWRLSNTMDSNFCVEALEEALAHYEHPEIFSTDQGSQFTSEDFTDVLKSHNIQISMDGKRRWIDNVMVERLWRSLKYEEVYLNAYESVAEARRSIGIYLEFFNQGRKHQSLGELTPDEVYYEHQKLAKAA